MNKRTISAVMREMGRKGGKASMGALTPEERTKRGKTSAKNLTPEQLTERAKTAAQARWSKSNPRTGKKATPPTVS